MIARRAIDQLRSDPHPAARLPDTTFEEVANSEFLADLLRLDHFTLVQEGRVTGDNEEARELGEVGDEVFGNPVTEVFLLRVAAHIGKRQYGNRRLIGESDSLGVCGSHLRRTRR